MIIISISYEPVYDIYYIIIYKLMETVIRTVEMIFRNIVLL